jgi:hypothetical protein
MGVKIDDDELEQVWPLFNLDFDGEISIVEWGKFFAKANEWSYHVTADRFSNLNRSSTAFRPAESRTRDRNGAKIVQRRPFAHSPISTTSSKTRLFSKSGKAKALHSLSPPVNRRSGGKKGFGKLVTGGGKTETGKPKKSKKVDDHFISPQSHKAFGGSGLLYRRQSVTRGAVVEATFE